MSRREETSEQRAARLAEHGYANAKDVLELTAIIEKLRQEADPMLGAYGITDDSIRSWLAEGIHTAFRKGSDHPNAHAIHVLIAGMPNDEWGRIVDYVAGPTIKWLRDAQTTHMDAMVAERIAVAQQRDQDPVPCKSILPHPAHGEGDGTWCAGVGTATS